jgi:CheY-like chemotaxis protein
MPKILIADDSRFQVKTFAAWLGTKGFDVISAFDTMQASTAALRSSPDLILLDINMPGGTGLEVLRRLRISSKTQHIPVIVVSGDRNSAIESEARNLGAAEFLHKPVEQDQLCAAVQRALTPVAPEAEH